MTGAATWCVRSTAAAKPAARAVAAMPSSSIPGRRRPASTSDSASPSPSHKSASQGGGSAGSEK